MAVVRRLPEALVNQIAAGEVVERPASVVKELVENALDAGARRVVVDVEGGGVALVSVADDGCGMSREDALLALERHATSKLRTLDDLAAIATLGFRGEALPSIASVSRLALTTADDDSGLGTEVVAERGAPPEARPARYPRGTRVVVEDLFGNVPARRKFLKSPDAELRAIVKALTSLALARPDVAFTLRSGARTYLDVPAARGDAERLGDVLGHGRTVGAVPISRSAHGFSAKGVVTSPELSFPSRAYQWVFLNRRPIRDGSISHAAALAAREVLGDGRFPAFALFLECDPARADVNVHPQKLEVRFREPGAVHSLVHRALRDALSGAKGAAPLPAASWTTGFGGGAPSFVSEAVAPYGGGVASVVAPLLAEGELETIALQPAPGYGESAPADSPVGALRLLGQYRDSYLVAEGEAGLVLVDQHAAHERVRYERIVSTLRERAASSQPFLAPVPFEASAAEAAALRSAEPLLAQAGFVISELSGRSFLVSAAPPECPPGAVAPFLTDFLARAAEDPLGGGEAAARSREALAASLACRGAVTIHTRLSPQEASMLLRDLAACEDPFSCPHGRPTLLALSQGELEKRFGRR